MVCAVLIVCLSPRANMADSRHVEKYLATEAPHKHLVFVLNKIDLVPSSTAVSFHSLTVSLLVPLSVASVSRLAAPRAFVRILPHYHAPWEIIRYIPGRAISISNVSGLVFRLGIGSPRLGVLPPETGRVSDELKTTTVRLGQRVAVFLVMIHTSQQPALISVSLCTNGY